MQSVLGNDASSVYDLERCVRALSLWINDLIAELVGKFISSSLAKCSIRFKVADTVNL